MRSRREKKEAREQQFAASVDASINTASEVDDFIEDFAHAVEDNPGQDMKVLVRYPPFLLRGPEWGFMHDPNPTSKVTMEFSTVAELQNWKRELTILHQHPGEFSAKIVASGELSASVTNLREKR